MSCVMRGKDIESLLKAVGCRLLEKGGSAVGKKAEYDGVPVYTLMETALQKFVAHNA